MLHIIVLLIDRYPFGFMSLVYNLLSCITIIFFSIYFDTNSYLILFCSINIISSFWINSSKRSIKNCENNLLRLLYHNNYYKTYQRDKYNDIDNNMIIEDKFCNGISYFHIHSKQLQNRDTLVIFHGYYSGKAFATELIRPLSRYYDLIIPDMPGNGLSHCIKWYSWILTCKLYKKSTKQIEEYIVNILHNFLNEIGINNNGKQFYLLAHSFGAYIATLYSINYPKEIKNNIILLSPVAISNIDKPDNFDKYVNSMSSVSLFGMYMKYGWSSWCSMQRIARCIGPCFASSFVKWRMSAMKHTFFWSDIDEKYKDELYYYWFKYTYNMYLGAPSSLFERLFYDFIGPYIYSNDDISERFIKVVIKNKINVLMCHGDQDWVSDSGAKHICNEIKKHMRTVDLNVDVDDIKLNESNDDDINVVVKTIKNASHQMIMNQPIFISNLIHEFIQQNIT